MIHTYIEKATLKEAAEEAASGRSDSTEALAAKIARDIFKIGDDILGNGGKTSRIQYMGGEWPAEKQMGGLCETALAKVIARSLAANAEVTGTPHHETNKE